MPKTLTELTKEHIAQIPNHNDKWLKIGFSTEPADFERATVAITACYKLIGLAAPKFYYVASPNLCNRVGVEAVKKLHGDNSPATADELREGANNDRGGQFWAGWCAYISFFRDVMGWEDDSLAKFALDEEITKTCGRVWWHEEVCVVSDRPTKILRDAEHRLHSITEPAIQYRNGWSLSFVHGVSIPNEWVTDRQNLDPKLALTWRNIEQRRAVAEIVGWRQVLKHCKATQVSSDSFGTLLEVELPDSDGPSRFVQVMCGTGREFVLAVPATVTSAREGVAWSYGLDSAELYAPEVRT